MFEFCTLSIAFFHIEYSIKCVFGLFFGLAFEYVPDSEITSQTMGSQDLLDQVIFFLNKHSSALNSLI